LIYVFGLLYIFGEKIDLIG